MSSRKIPTRDRILKSTWKLLEDGGGSNVRMSDIAKAAKISRQALYLHFPNRAELLIATTRFMDEAYDVEGRLAESRSAESGKQRLAAWVAAWGNYIPNIYGIIKALSAMRDHDKEADAAWTDRMQAVREGCAAAITALKADGDLTDLMSEREATDVLWALVSVPSWEQLRVECGWSQERYIALMQAMAARMLVKNGQA